MGKDVLLALALVAAAVSVTSSAVKTPRRRTRFVEFDPPRITPDAHAQTVKARDSYTFRCEGTDRGVSWRLPVDATEELRSRVKLAHSARVLSTQPSRSAVNVAQLTIRDLDYRDTGTFVCTYNGTVDTASIDNSTRVHLFVDDGVHLLKQSGVTSLRAVQSESLVLPCQPTHPEVEVRLLRDGAGEVPLGKFVTYDPKVGFRISPVTMEQHSGVFTCEARARDGRVSTHHVMLHVNSQTAFVPPPVINRTLASHVTVGHDFTVACSVTVDLSTVVELTWKTPNGRAIAEGRVEGPQQSARNLSMAGTHLKIVEQGLTVRKATQKDQGTYTCSVEDHSGNKKSKSEFVPVLKKEQPFLRVYSDASDHIITSTGLDDDARPTPVRWVVQIESHPEPSVTWFGPNGRPIPDPDEPYPTRDFKVETRRNQNDKSKYHTTLSVKRVALANAGTYVVKVKNGDLEEADRFTLEVRSRPEPVVSVVGTSSSPRLYRVGHEYKLRCSVTGSPIPNVSWSFKECSNFNSCNGRTVPLKADYEKYSGKNSVTSDLSRVATKSGQFSCMACNDVDCQYSKVVFFVTDVEDDGFAMTGPERAMEGDHVKLTCKASVYNFTRGSMRWYKDSTEGEEEITGGKTRLVFKQISTKWSFGEELHFKNLSLADKGLYFCRVKSNSGDEEDQDVFPGSPRRHLGFGSQRDGQERQMSPRRSHRLRVISLEAPRRKSSNLNGGRTIVERPQDGLRLECLVSGRPAPRVFWRLNGELVRETVNTTRVSIVQEGQVLEVSYVSPADEGLYSCVAENKVGAWSSQEIVALRATVETETAYENLSVPVIVAVAVAVALVIVIVCVVKLCYDGRSRKRKVKASSAAAAARSPTGWKAPPTPPTPLPRLMTQYEMSPEEEIDPDDSGSVVDCRRTIANGSVTPSLMPFFNAGSGHCHCHVYTPCHSAMGTLRSVRGRDGGVTSAGHAAFAQHNCSICDFGQATLPLNRAVNPVAAAAAAAAATLQRPAMAFNVGGAAGNGTLFRLGRAGSYSPPPPPAPRLSAEF